MEKDSRSCSLPSDIDEAAEGIASDIAPTHPDIDWNECFEKIKDGIKAGAEWMAEQGETVEGDVEGDWRNQEDAPYEIYIISDCLPQDTEFKFGDKVVVQIRKK